jgi:hypothetical protein
VRSVAQVEDRRVIAPHCSGIFIFKSLLATWFNDGAV